MFRDAVAHYRLAFGVLQRPVLRLHCRRGTWLDGVFNLICVMLGVVIGKGASVGIGALTPILGAAALPVVVLIVASVVVSLREAPRINNLLCYFLGLIAFFAMHQPPSIIVFATLGGAASLGSLAAWLAQALQRRTH